MHIELVSLVRCPVPHADGWLVAAVDRSDARVILEGTLGCPTCGAEYAIRGGVTYMTATPDAPARNGDGHVTLDPMRLAALLGITESSQNVALIGHDVRDIEALQELTQARCLAINPPLARKAATGVAPVGVIVSGATIPVAASQFHAVSIGEGSELLVEMAVHTLRPGGRLLAPVGASMPTSMHELARDQSHWVAERLSSPSRPVPISRRTVP